MHRARQYYLHRIVMEILLGRPLLTNEVVHHRDGDKGNNCPHNLELFGHAHHAWLHNRTSPLVAYCAQCHKPFLHRLGLRGAQVCCSRKCSATWRHRAPAASRSRLAAPRKLTSPPPAFQRPSPRRLALTTRALGIAVASG